MNQMAQMPIYDSGNAPEVMAFSIGKIEAVGPMVSFYLCIPRDVGGERVRYVTGIINVPREAVPAMIAMTELAMLDGEVHLSS